MKDSIFSEDKVTLEKEGEGLFINGFKFHLMGSGAVSEFKCRVTHARKTSEVDTDVYDRTAEVKVELDSGMYRFDLTWKDNNKERGFRIRVNVIRKPP